ncbi:MAG TPA: sigma-70 family RNA polymerase sigma factor [Bryobacteraceae bacterium]|nr:sigma-70 family RNA polymerase sigma factor [Bryobacteraceae bacterium]
MGTTDRGTAAWKRFSNQEEVRSNSPETESEEALRDKFFELVSPYLDRLSEFVRHVIEYAVASGDLVRDELTVEDVVDDVLVRAFRQFRENAAPRNVESWLIQLTADRIESNIKRLKREHERLVAIEEDIPETPPEQQVSNLGDEILEYHQPDEDLKLEDIVPDMETPTPEEETAREEVRDCVRRVLNTLPEKWRKVLLLYHVEGLRGEPLAKSVGLTTREVRLIQGSAAKYLRHRLRESGCVFRPS